MSDFNVNEASLDDLRTRGASEEKKLSKAMQKCMDRLSFSPALVVLDYFQRDENMQNRMMDLIMSFLHTYADYYRQGMTREGETMHRIGQMSETMLASLTATSEGRHAHRATPSYRRGKGFLP